MEEWNKETNFSEENSYYYLEKKDSSYKRVWKQSKQFIGVVTVSTKLKIGYVKNDVLYWREITPKEEWLLMGYSEEDFNKVKHLSKSILSHTAGNSMVVGVMEEVWERTKNLIENKEREVQTSLLDVWKELD